MKKIIVIGIVVLLILSGCTVKTDAKTNDADEFRLYLPGKDISVLPSEYI